MTYEGTLVHKTWIFPSPSNSMNQEYVRKLLKKPFVRVGLPFLTTIVGASFVFKELMQVKLNIRKQRTDQASQAVAGDFLDRVASPEEKEQLRKNIQKLKDSWEEEERKHAEEKAARLRHKQENWRNIRGPREGEDELGMQNERRQKLGMPEESEKEGIWKYRNKLTVKKEDL